MNKTIILVVTACFLFSLQKGNTQKVDSIGTDSVITTKIKSEGAFKILFKGKPGRAFAYSLALPGLGQIYNHRYWKVPIIYAGLSVPGYFIYFNKKEYNRFDDAYHKRVDFGDKSTDEFINILSLQQINVYRKYYDDNFQKSCIFFVLVYLLNGVEAFTDRHLQSFDVNDDLGLRIKSEFGTPVVAFQYKF